MSDLRYERLLERLKATDEARNDLVTFARLLMPDPSDADNVSRSLYDAAKHHRAIAAALEEVERGNYKRLIINAPPRHGKSAAHDTPVLTPGGWTTHGELAPGDTVFGPDGKPTLVIALSPDVDEVVPVTLTNGETIRVHLNHEWTVYDRDKKRWRTLETRDIRDRGVWIGEPGKRGGRARFQLPDTPCVEFPEAILPLHPYALGAWLGDGSANAPRIAHDVRDTEVIAGITACGYELRRQFVQPNTGVGYAVFSGPKPGVGSPFQRGLRIAGVLENKHIPDLYLRASTRQRLQLLAGLVDTDGHVEKETGRVRIVCGDPRLAEGIFDLCTTLGFRPYISTQEPKTSTSGVVGRETVYTVGFQPNTQIPTRVPRKQNIRLAPRRRVSIASVGPIEKGGARSIQVAHPSGLYLIGRQLNVTHNTELVSKLFVAWYMGRNPRNSVIFGTYNEKYAGDIGRKVRDYIWHPVYQQIFPGVHLKEGSEAADRLQTMEGGLAAFVGRGGTTTGRGGDLIVIDDPIKDRKEADSPTIREDLWEWFTQVIKTRMMDKTARILIVQTRWHEDDLVGRLTDPLNEFYDAEEAANWKVIDLPALAESDDPLGRQPGEALWPERFDDKFLLDQQRGDPRGFSALYQGRPTPPDGSLVKDTYIKTYKIPDLPKNLRYYIASDHAVSTKTTSDKTCMIPIGVDEQDNIYVLPDVVWAHLAPDKAVDKMLDLMRKYKPLIWWAEKTHISKSIGPFLRKRMREENVHVAIHEMTPLVDKVVRAQSIVGRMANGRVYFPERTPWFAAARDELLKFPHAAHDDFVDTLAWVGLGLTMQVTPRPAKKYEFQGRGPLTFGKFLRQSNQARRDERLAADTGGW